MNATFHARLHHFPADLPIRVAALLMGAVLLFLTQGAFAQDPVFSPAVNIDQADILAGKVPLEKLLESGGQFWTTPYTVADGVGEGSAGPRAQQRAWMYPNNPAFPFLRLNGLDSQSCYECHNSIGSYVAPGTVSKALIRKPGSVGGSAGFNSDAFINPLFPKPPTLLVRNPPHVFGVGYVQHLAYEMTHDLLTLQTNAQAAAKLKPGVLQAVPLISKTIAFGTFQTTYDKATGAFKDDYTKVTGVSNDLIVRPLQWKGIASSVRHFVRDALDFHLSMQAVEKVAHYDCDKDGKTDEVTIGNVTAITAFVAMTRPPVQTPPGDAATLGQAIFSGLAKTRANRSTG